MPGRNKTGPKGQGPATGRGMGVCANRNRDAGMGRGGRGMGRGGGRGRGRGRGGQIGPGPTEAGGGFADAPLREESDELIGLRAEASRLKELLKNIEQRLSRFKTPENER